MHMTRLDRVYVRSKERDRIKQTNGWLQHIVVYSLANSLVLLGHESMIAERKREKFCQKMKRKDFGLDLERYDVTIERRTQSRKSQG